MTEPSTSARRPYVWFAGLALCAIGVIGYFAFFPGGPDATPATQPPGAALPRAAPAEAPPAATAQVPAKAPAPAKPPAVVQFPDGSTAPALNGVTEPIKLNWNNRPFSPICGKILDNGYEWYVHEDGTRSTVRMLDINGVPSPVGLVASPTEALPTSEEIEQQLRQQAGQPKR
ncbi:MAG: hypothetical protein FJ265_15300 [Planctomycetes bacterium]|nr:hypothetical protein [Planctomycetota bacterium]